MFPLSLEGEIRVSYSGDPSEAVDRSLTGLMIRLRKHKASTVIREKEKILFEAGLFRLVSSWNLLAPIRRGDVCITRDGNFLTVQYRLSFIEMVIVGTLMVFGFLAPFLWQAPGMPIPGKIVILFFAWLYLIGANFLITAARFPRFLRSSLAHPPDEVEAARYPEPEYPEFPEYGPKYEETPTVKSK